MNSTAPLRDQAFIADLQGRDGTTEALGESKSTANMRNDVFPPERVNVRVMEVRIFSSPVFHVWAHCTKGHSDE